MTEHLEKILPFLPELLKQAAADLVGMEQEFGGKDAEQRARIREVEMLLGLPVWCDKCTTPQPPLPLGPYAEWVERKHTLIGDTWTCDNCGHPERALQESPGLERATDD